MLVYFAVILSVLIGLCGMAVDVARMQMRTDQLQAAADAGALAAAGELAHGGSGSNYQTAASNDVAAYETANGIPSTVTVVTAIGANYGYYQNDYSTVQVTVSQSFPLIFMAVFTGRSSATVSAKAVAQMPPCVVLLGSPKYTGGSGLADLWLSSSGIQTSTAGCPGYAKDGIVVDGFSSIYSSQVRSSSASSSSSFGNTTYTPIYNAPTITDPLAYISEPSVGSCTNGTTPISDLNQSTGTTITLSPGTYCGKTNASATYVPGPGASCGEAASKITPAIDIEGRSTGCPSDNSRSTCSGIPTVTFNPGLYIIVGGMTLDCVTTISTGATLFFTQNSNVAYGQMHMTSTAWQVNAPNVSSADSIPGIVLMSDRNWVGSNQDFQFTFNTWNADGVLYITGTGIYEWQTPMSSPNYLNIVTSNLYDFGGSINVAFNYANLPAGNPLELNQALVQ